jgi:hypothetical protein
MKAFLLITLSLLSVTSFADSTAIENFLYDGSQEVKEVNLTTEETRTEYRTVRVPATCYRTEYRRQCHQRPPACRTVCDRNGQCRNRCTRGGTVCRSVPVRVPYTCWRNETRGYQVHDYDVETNVKIHVLNEDISNNPRENFKIKMTGDTPSFGVSASSNYFVFLDKKMKKERMQTGVKFVDIIYKVRLVSANEAKSVLSNGIQGVKLKNGILNFRVGAGFNLNEFSQKIRIYRNRRLGTDPLLLTKVLTTNEMNVQTVNNSTQIAINLRELGINLPSKMRVIQDKEYL